MRVIEPTRRIRKKKSRTLCSQPVGQCKMFAINWFDVIPVAITFLGIIFVQLCNVYLHLLSNNPVLKSADSVGSVPAEECVIRENSKSAQSSPQRSSITAFNGKLQKQQSSLDCDR